MIRTCFLDHSVGGIGTHYITILYRKTQKSHIVDTNNKDF